MKKIGMCGVYGKGSKFSGGQPVKTRMIYEQLSIIYGANEVEIANTNGWRSRPISMIVNCYNLTKKCENIIIMPAHNGIRVFSLIFIIFNMFFKRKLHYIVIGGWLPNLVQKNKILRFLLSKFDGIYVETSLMKSKLNKIGLENVCIMNNFKNLKPISKELLIETKKFPYKLCTFSRVIKEKGIEDAINAVNAVNSRYNRIVFTLDIYGVVNDDYKIKLDELLSTSSQIRYCGVVDSDKTVDILKNYFMQLFPTHFATEGIPGSIIDSYFAGVPILASRWDSFESVIEEGITGIGFELGNCSDLEKKLIDILYNPEEVYTMKSKCLEKSFEYSPECVMKEFVKFLG